MVVRFQLRDLLLPVRVQDVAVVGWEALVYLRQSERCMIGARGKHGGIRLPMSR